MADFKKYSWEHGDEFVEFNPEEDHVTFYTQSLMSKWGFGDGDMLGGHELLQAVVKKFIIPKLDQVIEYQEDINLCHNPIRATKVDGIDTSDFWYGKKEHNIRLTPETIDVSKQDIEDVWQTLK